MKMIRRETKNARNGGVGHIRAKMNSLCDKEVIAALYEASCAGVKIELVVRGICSLRAGVPGLSENISVHSIVGTFLEHGRIFYFENSGSPEVYLGSADWMPRNLDRRVEILFPVEDPELKRRVIHILDVQLQDNVKAQQLMPDGKYRRISKRGKAPVSAQKQFCEEAVAAAKKQAEGVRIQDTRVFVPIMGQE